jgi:hypothetical protein
MLSCQKIIELASKHLNTSLLKRQRMELILHLWMCKNCRRYVKQLSFLQKIAKNMDKNTLNITLSNEARQRIQKKLQK